MQHTIKPPASYKIPCHTAQHTVYRLCIETNIKVRCVAFQRFIFLDLKQNTSGFLITVSFLIREPQRRIKTEAFTPS